MSVLNRDWASYSSEQSRGGVVSLEDPPPEVQAEMDAVGDAGRLMLMMDPPDHTRHRKLVNRGFTPKVIRSLEDHLRELSVRIIERARSGDGSCDFVVDVAAALPLRIICDMMGVPASQFRYVFDRTNIILGCRCPPTVAWRHLTARRRIPRPGGTADVRMPDQEATRRPLCPPLVDAPLALWYGGPISGG